MSRPPLAEPVLDDHETRYQPVGIDARYPGPGAGVHPNPELGWFRRLLPVIAQHRRPLIVGLSAGLVALVIQVAAPAVARAAIDSAGSAVSAGGSDAASDTTAELTRWVLLLVALGIGRFLTAMTYRYSLFEVAWGVETDLRGLLYRHLTRLPFSYFDRTQSGEVISRANSDIRSIQVLLAFGPLVSMSVVAFVLAFVFMLTIHLPLTLVALSTLPGVYVFGQKLRTNVFPLTWVGQARQAELATIVDESVNGTRVVKSFAGEERQVNQLARAADHLRWANVEAVRQRALWNPLIEALPRIGMAMVLLYGGWLAIDGQVSIGTLFAFNAYVLMLQAPFRMFGFLLLQAQRAGAAATRVYAVLDEPVTIDDAPDAVDLTDPTGRIEFDGVSFAYPHAATTDRNGPTAERPKVLDDFTLTIEPGETVAIVGRTGSGKSTIARLLARFYEPDAGQIRIDGQPIDSLTIASLRHHVGIVFDEPFLFSTTIRDNIAYGRPNADIADIEAAARDAQAHDFITDLATGGEDSSGDDAGASGYDTVVGERGYTLSGGQRQRIAIARTLLEAPAVLVLDDATSAIDVTVEARIHDALHERLADRTTILIAHRLSTIALADRVVLVEGGQIVAAGTHSELLASEPRYVHILAEADPEADGENGSEPGTDRARATGADRA